MKNSEEETTNTLRKNKKLVTVSARKLEANRKNAQKSTGPKTLRGKTHSRSNATKYGLFSRETLDFIAHGELPMEYEEVPKGLDIQYQPVGKAEELEVERLALCWWRLKRAWRYENAMNRLVLADYESKHFEHRMERFQEQYKEDQAVILELQKAKEEITATGEISPELKQRIITMMPGFEVVSSIIERIVEEKMNEPSMSKMCQQFGPKFRSSFLASQTVTNVIGFVEESAELKLSAAQEIATAQHVIPNGDAPDKVLRYEAAFERQLGRTVDRLERLQRRRKGEMVPPPLNVHLTR